jgi:hypothetical protein
MPEITAIQPPGSPKATPDAISSSFFKSSVHLFISSPVHVPFLQKD